MTFKAGFSAVDISPTFFPIRTYFSAANEIVDPIYARAAAFSDGKVTLAILSFDVVIVEWEYVQRLRKDFAAATDLPENRLLVCATHNHACPAVVDRPENPKEPAYIDFMIARGVEAAKKAIAALEEAEMSLGSVIETRVSYNRRFIMKNGTAITQPSSLDNILCNEGVIDPNLEVAAFRRPNGEIFGVLINFASHACHLMGKISGGFPGVLYRKLTEFYGPGVGSVFLNGACGNIIHYDYTDKEKSKTLTKEFVGAVLAEDVQRALESAVYRPGADLSVSEERVPIRYRDFSELERNIDNPAWFVNVFATLIKRDWFRYSLARLKEARAAGEGADAIVQVIRIGELFLVAIPAEYFTEFGLKIKEKTGRPTMVVTLANGWLGYIPTPEALARKGGHETTLHISSKMEPDAGDLMADSALRQIQAIVADRAGHR